MRKAAIIGAVCAMFISQSAAAQNANEVQYVEDPAQGYLFNKFSDNWFITAEGGATLEVNKDDGHRKLMDRFAPAASIYVGKWFSPLLGVRAGVNLMQVKSLTPGSHWGRPDEPTYDGLYKNKFSELGPVADVMLNVTNWWCGYRPGRFYNAIVYGGGGGYFSFYKAHDAQGHSTKWEYAHERILTVRFGLLNQFNLSKNFALGLDLRYSLTDSHTRDDDNLTNQSAHVLQAYLSATYLFNKTDWSPAVVPVCPPAENCDPLRRELADANMRIAELERQLDACLKRPVGKSAPTVVTETVEKEGPLATIYFPIGVSKLTEQDRRVICAVAEVMKENPNLKYTVTGWADNYTGNDQINTRLRHERANNAAKMLQTCGVPADQLNVTINAGNLSDLGEKFVALDRAVTIEKGE